MDRVLAERLILEHLGEGWEVGEPDVLAVRVLLDRLQEEGLSLIEACCHIEAVQADRLPDKDFPTRYNAMRRWWNALDGIKELVGV